MSECTDPKGHFFVMQANNDSKCDNCKEIQRYDDATKSWTVIKPGRKK